MEPASQELHGDRALTKGDPDRLGFREVATRLATAIAGPGIRGNFVIGLEGRWGSGKSSLLNLLREELGNIRGQAPHTVVAFEPWLVGNRDALLGSLFGALLAAIARVESEQGDSTRSTNAAIGRAMEAARGFATALGGLGDVVEVAGSASGLVPISLVGKGLKALGKAAKPTRPPTPLSEHKRRLTQALEDLGHRFIVTIDDLDRLDPAEALEVLRLTRSVADLPGVVYVLCYDGEVLARSIERAATVDDGRAYLEKIVQTTIMVPRPEVFQLRHWLSDELRSFAAPLDDDALERLRRVVDLEGGRELTTPRSVNRILDSLRLLWPVLQPYGVDLPDLVWLQLVKDGSPKLYRWVEEYCAVVAEISLGVARVDEQQREAMMDELLQVAGDRRFDNVYYRHCFAEQLPGVASDYGKDSHPLRLFEPVRPAARDRAIADRRLKSPDHYRIYFALSEPTHALTATEIEGFWAAAAAGASEAGAALIALHTSATTRNIGKADLLLERLGVTGAGLLTARTAENVLLALADTVDDAYLARHFDRDWVFSLSDRAERLVPSLLGRLGERRTGTVSAMFERGRALSWLTQIYRGDIFRQGRFGTEGKPEGEWLFTSAELDAITEVMTARYRAMSLDDVLSTLEPRRLLFTWSQAGDEAGVRAVLAPCEDDDAAFLRLLKALRSQIGTSEGRFDVLKRDTIANFMDAEVAITRLQRLADGDASAQAADAADLLADLRRGDDY